MVVELSRPVNTGRVDRRCRHRVMVCGREGAVSDDSASAFPEQHFSMRIINLPVGSFRSDDRARSLRDQAVCELRQICDLAAMAKCSPVP